MVSPGSHKALEYDGSCLVSFSSGWSLYTKKSLSYDVKWVTRVFLSPAHIAAGVPGYMAHTEVVVSHHCFQLCWGKRSTYQCNWERAGQGSELNLPDKEPDLACGILATDRLLWMDLTHHP